ncbi:hypothetical protein CRENBAI_005213 [Crenichthys baileyi]|uniref:Uncharacterized protein n=1 Tax=Crenichthys baileyi TaxID=28760 RepID=A0AAV9RUX6_9TELE
MGKTSSPRCPSPQQPDASLPGYLWGNKNSSPSPGAGFQLTHGFESLAKKELKEDLSRVLRDDATEAYIWRDKSLQANFSSTWPFPEELESWNSF